jgi:hypothetical protein
MSVKLTHVLWRKFLPFNRLEADEHLNQIIFELLIDSNYNLAITISNFATDIIKKFSTEQMRKFIVINKAIAYKFLDKQKECDNVIKNEDWTIGNEFKLAKLVLEDNFEEAITLMLKIGDNDELITKDAYRKWPLFKKFRKNKLFQETYLKIFNEEFSLEEIELTEKDKNKNGDKGAEIEQDKDVEHENTEQEDIEEEDIEQDIQIKSPLELDGKQI